MKRADSSLLLAAILMAAGVGTASASENRPVRSLLEARHENVVVQEWDSSCGAAALATLLRFQLGDPVTERAVALGILRRTDPDRVRGRGGFSLLDLKRYAETRGFAADGYAGLTAGQLLRLAPAIVPIRSNGGDHFVVFRGVVGGQAVLADPAFGNRTLPYGQFESQWKDRLGFAVKARARAGANRLMPTRRDLLRVEDDAARVMMDDALPKPLADWQLAQAVAVESAATGQALTAEAAPGFEKSGSVKASIASGLQGPGAESGGHTAPTQATISAPPLTLSTPPTSTTSTLSTVPSPTTITGTVTAVTGTAPTLPTISAPLPVSIPTVTAPITLPPPLGRR